MFQEHRFDIGWSVVCVQDDLFMTSPGASHTVHSGGVSEMRRDADCTYSMAYHIIIYGYGILRSIFQSSGGEGIRPTSSPKGVSAGCFSFHGLFLRTDSSPPFSSPPQTTKSHYRLQLNTIDKSNCSISSKELCRRRSLVCKNLPGAMRVACPPVLAQAQRVFQSTSTVFSFDCFEHRRE